MAIVASDAITVGADAWGDYLRDQDFDALEDAVAYARELGNRYWDSRLYGLHAERTDHTDYDWDGLQDEEREALQAAFWEGQAVGQARHAAATDALVVLDRHRRALGMGPLDRRRAGWSDQEILDEVGRLRREGILRENPLSQLRRRLMPP